MIEYNGEIYFPANSPLAPGTMGLGLFKTDGEEAGIALKTNDIITASADPSSDRTDVRFELTDEKQQSMSEEEPARSTDGLAESANLCGDNLS